LRRSRNRPVESGAVTSTQNFSGPLAHLDLDRGGGAADQLGGARRLAGEGADATLLVDPLGLDLTLERVEDRGHEPQQRRAEDVEHEVVAVAIDGEAGQTRRSRR
jgi:hypothetical protein